MTPSGCITQVPGIFAGHYTFPQRPTGCSVVLCPEGAIAAVDVRGAAPGTRETDLLQSGNLVDKVHGILLAGGSAWGLDAATGVVQWLEENHAGLDTGYGKLPLVPAAVLFDLAAGNPSIRPDAAAGYAACRSAAAGHPLAQGNVGAGAGATVGKLFGSATAMKGGLGTACIILDGIAVGAMVACNAVGDVRDPESGRLLAGARLTPDSLTLRDTRYSLLQGNRPATVMPGVNTTIGVIATNASLRREQLQRMTVAGHDGLARCIQPVHTQLDGDTLFALSTGHAQATLDLITLTCMAAAAVEKAVVSAMLHASAMQLGTTWWPAASTLLPHPPAAHKLP